MPNVKLLLAFHCHQPVGNFDNVFQEALDKAYHPFIEALSRHHKIKFAIHYSGSLLDWLMNRHPEYLEKVKLLVRRGQAEILTAGYYEPILPLISPRDAVGQIEMLTDTIRDIFSYDARGSWLTERVWEPKLPKILSDSGVKYTIVDDSHFKLVSRDPEELSGYYSSDDERATVGIFAGSEKLRYLMPFKEPEASIDYLRARLAASQEDLAITFADDGEKFGLWPGTYKWVYKDGWLEKFLSALEKNSDWIKTQTLCEYYENNQASGRVYLTCASYREMMEWSGGFFRNFFVKYSESNNMHKKMLYISDKVDGLPASSAKDKDKARRELYKAQANDAYWHGVFGGLYLNHLRSSIYNHLIEAENIVDRALNNKDATAQEVDIDLDGNQELLLKNKEQALYFSPLMQGALYEWDLRAKAINLTNTIMRRYEKYHERLKAKAGNVASNNEEGPSSIHDLSLIKGDISKIYYDCSPRYSLFEHFLDSNITLDDFVASNYQGKDQLLNKRYNYHILPGTAEPSIRFFCCGCMDKSQLDIEKTIALGKNINVNYELRNTGTQKFSSVLGIEFNLSLYDSALSKAPVVVREGKLRINDEWYGLKIDFKFDREPLIWCFPVETVSESESGIEKTYQQLCILFQWQLNILPRVDWKMNIGISVE